MIRKVSVVVPVLGEAERINGLLSHLRRQVWPGTPEVVVVDGDASGATLRVIRDGTVRKTTAPGGRGVQMNAGAALCSGDMLLFLHADTRLPPDGIRMAAGLLADPRWSAGAFLLGIDSKRPAVRLVERVANCRSRLAAMPYGDQALFFPAQVFRAVGGFRSIPIMEDVELMRRLRRMGLRTGFVPAKVSTSARRWDREGVAYTTLRNWTLLTLFLLGVSPHRLARFYRTLT